MTLLSSAVKAALRVTWCSDLSRRREAFGLTRAQLDAAVDATDSWIDSNATAYNSALPTAARNNLTAAQKAELFALVALKRYGG